MVGLIVSPNGFSSYFVLYLLNEGADSNYLIKCRSREIYVTGNSQGTNYVQFHCKTVKDLRWCFIVRILLLSDERLNTVDLTLRHSHYGGVFHKAMTMLNKRMQLEGVPSWTKVTDMIISTSTNLI